MGAVMDTEKLIPSLRFKEFGDAWVKDRVDSFVKRENNPVKVDKELKYKQIGIRSHGKGIFHKIAVTGKELGNKRVFWVHPDAFIVNIVFAWEQAVTKSSQLEKGFIASHRFPMFVPLKNKSDLKFLLYFFLRPKGKHILELASPGGAGRNKTLGQNEFAKSKIIVPSLKEQQKIANFLTAIDQRIILLKQKKAALELYKKGLMQKIFSQKIRFRDDDGKGFSDWVEIKLGDIGNTLNGLTGKTKENFGRGKRYIQYTQIFKGSKINIDECGLVEISSNEKQTLLNKGDVLFTTSSETPHEIGISSVIVDDIDEIYLNSFCFGYRQTENTYLPEFSQFFFRSANVRKEIIKLAQGSTRFGNPPEK